MAFLFQKRRYLNKIKPDIARNNKHLEEREGIFYYAIHLDAPYRICSQWCLGIEMFWIN
jgi:hypothetical protein